MVEQIAHLRHARHQRPRQRLPLSDGGIVPDPEGVITGGHENKTARTVAIYEGEPVNADALAAMLG